jgi:hypothetical protein
MTGEEISNPTIIKNIYELALIHINKSIDHFENSSFYAPNENKALVYSLRCVVSLLCKLEKEKMQTFINEMYNDCKNREFQSKYKDMQSVFLTFEEILFGISDLERK